MKDLSHLEMLRQSSLTRYQQKCLFEKIGIILKKAIDARSPKNRPPGKAGLKAEKGYYRLLYLEGEFHQQVEAREMADPDGQPYNWHHEIEMLRQLADIPELQAEILMEVKSALNEIITPLAGQP